MKQLDKSYVTLEQAICIVCGNTYDIGSLLSDKRLKPVFDKHTVTHNGVCTECQKGIDMGGIWLVAIDETKSKKPITLETAHRTGRRLCIKREAVEAMFNMPLGEHPLVHVDDAIVQQIIKDNGL